MAKSKKKPKAAKPAKKKAAKVKLSAAAKNGVTNIKASEQLGASYLAKIEKLAEMDTGIARISGERKNLMSDRAALARELDEDAKELARVAAGGHAELLFSEANIKDQAKLSQPAPKSAEGETVTATASASVKTTANELAAQDAFDAISLDALPTIKGACKDKLLAEGIRTGKELRLWRNGRFAKKISGIGDSALQIIDDAMADWFIKNPVKPSPAPKPTQPAKQTPDSVIVGKMEIIASVPDLFSVYVAPRESGKLCYGFWIKAKSLANLGEVDQDYFGHYEPDDREKLYRDALDACTSSVKALETGGLVGPKEREACSKIRLAIIEAGKLIKKPKKTQADSGESVNVAFVH